MTKQIRKTIYSLSFIAITLAFVSGSFAYNPYSPGLDNDKLDGIKEKVAEKKLEIEEKKQEGVEKRCDIITKRIDNRINAYYNNKEAHLNRYRKLDERLSNLLDRLEDEGYDVDTLRDKLSDLELMILEAADMYDEFAVDLEGAKDYECGETQGSFVDAVKNASGTLKGFRDKMVEIRAYFKDEIRPLLVELREEIKEMKAEEAAGLAEEE